MRSYWLTISVPSRDEAEAETVAHAIAVKHNGRVVEVQPEPPQGSTIVGDMHEDGLA